MVLREGGRAEGDPTIARVCDTCAPVSVQSLPTEAAFKQMLQAHPGKLLPQGVRIGFDTDDFSGSTPFDKLPLEPPGQKQGAAPLHPKRRRLKRKTSAAESAASVASDSEAEGCSMPERG